MGQEPDEIREQIEETRARMGETVEAIGYKADVKSRAKESIVNTKDRVVGRVAGAKDSIVGSAASAKESVAGAAPDSQQVRQQAERAVSVAQENPIGLAIGAAAVGFLAGMAIPSSRIEDEKLGPIADDLKTKARETGQEVLDRGKQVAQEVGQRAAESVQDAAQQVAQTGKESAQQQGQELASSAKDQAQDLGETAQRQVQDATSR